MTINILYLCRRPLCKRTGEASYTRHLIDMFRMHGDTVRMFRISQRTEGFLREFDEFHVYQNIAPHMIDELDGITIITNHDRSEPWILREVLREEHILVMHDRIGNTKETLDLLYKVNPQVVVIREANLSYFPGAVFVPHPYVRIFKNPIREIEYEAISLCRISPVKNIPMLIKAGVMMFGAGDDRMYMYHHLDQRFPGWRELYAGPFAVGEAPHLARKARYVVDLTVMIGDGAGGTQYTFFEAWDAGATVIVHKAWLGGEIDPYVIPIEDVDNLKAAIRSKVHIDGQDVLKWHSPEIIYPQFMDVIKR